MTGTGCGPSTIAAAAGQSVSDPAYCADSVEPAGRGAIGTE